MQELLASGSVRLRPSGLFDHPIVFADFILVSLPILAAGALSLRRPLERAAAWGAFGVGLAGLALSLARGAWLSALLGAVVFVVLGLRVGLLGLSALRRLVVPVAVLGLLTGLAFGPLIWERVTQSQSGNFRVRLDLNDIAMAMLADNPVGGVGLNNFLPAMHRYDPKDVMRYFPGPAHNLYLLEAAEGGWPALLLLLATGSGLALWSLRRLSRIDDPAMRWLAVAILSGFAAFAVSQLADFSYRLEPLRTVLWAWAGLLVGAVRVGTGEERT
jgi:hypothetical protein